MIQIECIGNSNGRMEDFDLISFVVCDKCKKKKPVGMSSLGWLRKFMNKKGEQTQIDICPNCQDNQERQIAQAQVKLMLENDLVGKGRQIANQEVDIKRQKTKLFQDCNEAKKQIKQLFPSEKGYIECINKALQVARIACLKS